MSSKNHKIVNGKLLQTDKRFSQLKMNREKKSINGCMKKHYITI